MDDLLGGDSDGGDDASWRVDDDSERYLVYAPQFGLGNQQITLRNAVVWAIFLNRTLVLPHILGHSGCSNESLCSATSQEMAAHADLFAIRQIPPVRVLDMRHFRRRSGGALRPRRLLVLGIKAVWAYRMTDVYWEQLGVAWHREPNAVETLYDLWDYTNLSDATWTPLKPEGPVMLDLNQAEERMVAKMLVHLGDAEAGENFIYLVQ